MNNNIEDFWNIGSLNNGSLLDELNDVGFDLSAFMGEESSGGQLLDGALGSGFWEDEVYAPGAMGLETLHVHSAGAPSGVHGIFTPVPGADVSFAQTASAAPGAGIMHYPEHGRPVVSHAVGASLPQQAQPAVGTVPVTRAVKRPHPGSDDDDVVCVGNENVPLRPSVPDMHKKSRHVAAAMSGSARSANTTGQVNQKNKSYTDEETTRLLTAVLGPDSNVFDIIVNQKKLAQGFPKVAKAVFRDTRSPASLASRYGRLLQIYKAMKEFETFTGGAGDADLYDSDGDASPEEAHISQQLEAMKKKNISVDLLSPTVIQQWRDKGWYDLFDNRLSSNSSVTRPIAYHEGRVSPFEGEAETQVLDPPSPPRQHASPPPRQRSQNPARSSTPHPTPSSSQTPARSARLRQDGVPEPASRKKAETSSSSFFAPMERLLKTQEQALENHAITERVKLAQKIDLDERASPEVKEAARKLLLKYFTDGI
ncbi:hypothetical protein DENSPDRAFT_887223 [Dentipellis sp. KUC8613]|nr:hypothetical protein DENSPDRAFT_887223 [Dentipellis sp. KUC8613]